MLEKLQHFRKLSNGNEKYIHIEIIFISCAMVKFKYSVLRPRKQWHAVPCEKKSIKGISYFLTIKYRPFNPMDEIIIR